MKKRIYVMLLMVCMASNLFAQQSLKPTKEQTIAWLKDKFSKYVTGVQCPVYLAIDQSTIFDKDTPDIDFKLNKGLFSDFDFDVDPNGYIIIKYSVDIYQETEDGWGNPYKHVVKGNVTISIPISDIKDHPCKSDQIDFKTGIKTIKWIRSNCEHALYTQESGMPKKYTLLFDRTFNDVLLDTICVIHFDFDREEDLTNRMNKAIANLQTYYPKPKNNEAF